MDYSRAEALGCRCSECPLKKLKRGPVFPKPAEHGDPRAVIIAEEPGHSEVKKGEPLIGASGSFVKRLMADNYIKRTELHLTNALLCGGQKTLKDREVAKAIECCKPRLDAEMASLPARIPRISFGELSLQALTGKEGISKWRGFPIDTPHGAVMPTFHPEFVLREPGYFPVVQTDIRRFLRGAPVLQEPEIVLVTDPAQAQPALMRLVDQPILGLDIETPKDSQIFDKKIFCVGAATDKLAVSVEWNILLREWNLFRRILCNSASLKVLQNENFDIMRLENHGFEVAPSYDILVGARLRFPAIAHTLDLTASLFYYFRKWKAEYKEVGDDAWRANSVAMMRYNALDSWMTRMCYEPLQALMEDPSGEEDPK